MSGSSSDTASREARARLNAKSPPGPNTHAANVMYDGTREGYIRSVMRVLAAAPDVIAVSFPWGDELVVVPRPSLTNNIN